MPIDLANPVSNHPLNDGLVSRWLPLDNNSGGRTLFDIKGINHGTLKNGPAWTAGPNGFGALSFDGSDDYVAAGTFGLSIDRPFTLSGYAYRAATGVIHSFLSLAYGGALLRISSGDRVQFVKSNVADIGNGATTVGVGWHHLAVTCTSGGDWVVYLNGRADGSGSTARTFGGTHGGTEIGRDQSFFPWNGRIQSGDVHTRALSAPEVFGLYDQSLRDYPDTLNRLSYSYRVFLGTTTPTGNRRRRVLGGRN